MAEPNPQWDAMTIPRTLARAVDLWPYARAVEDGEVRFSFSQLAAEVERTSRAFIAAGIAPGDRVGVWAPNSWQWRWPRSARSARAQCSSL